MLNYLIESDKTFVLSDMLWIMSIFFQSDYFSYKTNNKKIY